MKTAVRILGCFLVASAGLIAQANDAKPAKTISVSDKVKVKATVEAIDHTARTLTLKGPKGNLVVLEVDPAVTRFHEIKVGDEIHAEYYESVVVDVHKPGQKPLEASVSGAVAPTEGSKKPSGVAVLQETTTVTVDAIDASIPAVTVKTMDGQFVSFRVKKKKYLEGVAPGDQVVITRITGLLVDVK